MIDQQLRGLVAIWLWGAFVWSYASLAYAQAPDAKLQPSGNTSSLSEKARAHYERGKQQLRNDDAAGAVESFTLVIDEQPQYMDGYLARAQAYRRLEKQASSVEDRDRAALGYLNDEQRVTRQRSRSFILQEWNEGVTKRMLAMVAIYLTAWTAVTYMWWYQGSPLTLALLMFLIVHGVMFILPANPWLWVSIGPGMLLLLVAMVLKNRMEPRQGQLTDQPLEAELREKQAHAARSNPSDYATGSKICPQCAREVSEITRVCPRCDHRF